MGCGNIVFSGIFGGLSGPSNSSPNVYENLSLKGTVFTSIPLPITITDGNVLQQSINDFVIDRDLGQ